MSAELDIARSLAYINYAVGLCASDGITLTTDDRKDRGGVTFNRVTLRRSFFFWWCMPTQIQSMTTTAKAVRKRVASIKPSPENESIYGPILRNEAFDALADSIRVNGLMDELWVTRDSYIVSGHRRHAALVEIGQTFATCKVINKRRDEYTRDEYIALLREMNRYRDKDPGVQIREELIDLKTAGAWDRLEERRDDGVYAAALNGIDKLDLGKTTKRSAIGKDREEHVRLIKQIVADNKEFWPLSIRGVHYPLLNFDFIRGYYWPRRTDPDFGKIRTLKYANDDGSYDSTSDLITRLRINEELPWEAFDDVTRPHKDYPAFDDVREYIRQELGRRFLATYWRTYQRTQPNHVEILVEKNTVFRPIERGVADKYHIGITSARGFASIDTFYKIAKRFKASGKERLVLIVFSDFDPEGELIPFSAGQSLRDDFGIKRVDVIKAGVTRAQIEKYKLPTMNFAKETSSRFEWFEARTGGREVYEIEALSPQDQIDEVDAVVRGVIDVELFNRAVAAEEADLSVLAAVRDRAGNMIAEILSEIG